MSEGRGGKAVEGVEERAKFEASIRRLYPERGRRRGSGVREMRRAALPCPRGGVFLLYALTYAGAAGIVAHLVSDSMFNGWGMFVGGLFMLPFGLDILLFGGEPQSAIGHMVFFILFIFGVMSKSVFSYVLFVLFLIVCIGGCTMRG